jgi:hypothetical protein
VSAAALIRDVRRLRGELQGDGGDVGSCGPDCPPVQLRLTVSDWAGQGPSTAVRGPAACPRCGRPASIEELRVEWDDHWHNPPSHADASQEPLS